MERSLSLRISGWLGKKQCNETLLPEKEHFYSHLNMEDITDAHYAHAKRVCKDFEIKKLGEYYDFCFQTNTLLLPDVFENCRNLCLEI